jgi:small subunit ribosomal protein S6
MSRKYEGLIVLDTRGMEGSVDDLVGDIAKELESEGVKLEEIEQLGRKKFVYVSHHVDGGHYVRYVFEAEPEAIEPIKTRLKLHEKVHYQHYQRLD